VIFGPDVSRYQGAVDHARVRREGHEFLIAKISQGSSLRDPQWPRNRDGARAAGLITLGYHYIDTTNADAQARNCAAHLGDKSVPVALDHERGGGNIAQYRAVLDAFRRAGLRVVLSYIPPFYWREIGQPSLVGLPPLWKARYPGGTAAGPSTMYAKVPGHYWDAYGGQSPVLLQFTDQALVCGQKMDCNAFRGSREQFAALVGSSGGGQPTPLTPEGFLMSLSDAEQGEALAILRNLHFQLITGDGPKDHWGWQTWAGGTGERLTVIDYLRRSNERTESLAHTVTMLRTDLGTMASALARLGAGGVDSNVIAAVLRDAITAAGFELHGTLVAGSTARGAHASGAHPGGAHVSDVLGDPG